MSDNELLASEDARTRCHECRMVGSHKMDCVTGDIRRKAAMRIGLLETLDEVRGELDANGVAVNASEWVAARQEDDDD